MIYIKCSSFGVKIYHMYKLFNTLSIPSLFLFALFMSSCEDNSIDNSPSLKIKEVLYVTQTTAVTGGLVSSNGGSSIQNKGVCWSTNPNPTIKDSVIYGPNSSGWYRAVLRGLTPNTKYYVRAFGETYESLKYSKALTFTTSDEPSVFPPCTPDAGSMMLKGSKITFGAAKYTDGPYWGRSDNGVYGYEANGSNGTLRFEFSEIPVNGVYATTDGIDINEGECIIYGNLKEGISHQRYLSWPGDTVYVAKGKDGKLTFSFCDIRLGVEESTSGSISN